MPPPDDSVLSSGSERDAPDADPDAVREPAIRTRGLAKRYGETVAVHGLDLSVPPGTVYGFLGPNGAGKTTTMRMLTALTRPSEGEARVAGVDATDRAALVPHIGYLPEEPPLFEEFTGREMLDYYAGLRGLPAEAADARIEALLDRFDLATDADRRISGYSRGMRQKTAIAAAILHEPAVLFLDEPTGGLDPRAARRVRETVADLAAADTTVFLSTHVLPVVEELADVVGVLYDGRLAAEGPPEELSTRAAERGETLEDAFLEVTGRRGAGRGEEESQTDAGP
jgi:ABC-2 type transport system ATP-binding protein